MITNDQKRAKDAFGRVDKRSGNLAHQLPIIIRNAGLAQALEFVRSKATEKEPWKFLLDDLTHTALLNNLNEQQEPKDTLPNNHFDFATTCRGTKLKEYMRYTRDVMAACLWYSRFAESVLEVKRGEDDAKD
jgi:CRISPR-associated protein Cmr5